MGKPRSIGLTHHPKMFQVTLGASDDDAAGIQSFVPSDELDNLAGLLETGAISDGVQNKEDVRIPDNMFQLFFGVLQREGSEKS